MTRTRSRKGLLRRTAVAAGVKPKNLKALGPENAWPMVTEMWDEVQVGLFGMRIYPRDRYADRW